MSRYPSSRGYPEEEDDFDDYSENSGYYTTTRFNPTEGHQVYIPGQPRQSPSIRYSLSISTESTRPSSSSNYRDQTGSHVSSQYPISGLYDMHDPSWFARTIPGQEPNDPASRARETINQFDYDFSSQSQQPQHDLLNPQPSSTDSGGNDFDIESQSSWLDQRHSQSSSSRHPGGSDGRRSHREGRSEPEKKKSKDKNKKEKKSRK